MIQQETSKKVIVRFAPSPTGYLHIGGVRTALFNFLFARRNGGKFIVRIEDTDKERSKKEYEENIFESLTWLGLAYDGGVMRQSERGEVYKKYVQKLLDSGAAYLSEEGMTGKEREEKEEKGERRGEVIRFRNPNTEIVFSDIVRGEIRFDTTDLGDFVIAKDVETPLYHFAVVVDDFESGVTHVIRGEDHISNTPRQILIQQAIGAPRPEYAHIPLILAPDKSKLSKRHGAIRVTEWRDAGYLPEALLNYLALLGWNPGGEQEIFSMEELIEKFSLEKIQKSGAVFDVEKLKWMNGEHKKHREVKRVFDFLPGIEFIHPSEATAKVIDERIQYYGQAKELVDKGEFDYLLAGKEVNLDKNSLLKSNSLPVDNSKMHLAHIAEIMSNILHEDDFSPEKIKAALWEYATEHGRGNVLWPMRYALTGREKSPDPFTIASIIGKDLSILRLKKAYEILSA